MVDAVTVCRHLLLFTLLFFADTRSMNVDGGVRAFQGRFSTRDPWATALVKELEARGHLHTVNVPQGENSLISSFESMWVGVSGTNPAGGP